MIDLSFFSAPGFRLRFGRPAHVLHNSGSGYVCRSFLSSRRAKSLADLYGRYLSRAIVLSMVLSPVSGILTDRIGARFLLMSGVLILMSAFLIGANLARRLSLDLARGLAGAYRDRLGFF